MSSFARNINLLTALIIPNKVITIEYLIFLKIVFCRCFYGSNTIPNVKEKELQIDHTFCF